MNSDFSKHLLIVCKLFHMHKVQYMVVGGAAVALHGYFRGSVNMWGVINDKPDLDFWYNPTYENYYRLLNALSDLGQDVQEFKDEQAPSPRTSYFKFHLTDFTLDLLPQLKAPLNFRISYQQRETAHIDGIDIDYINLDDLIKDKEATARAKDIDDIEQLRNRRNISGS